MRSKVLIAATCLLAFSLVADAAAPLAGRLPAGSLIYVGWAGKTKAMDASMLGKFLEEPKLKEAIAGIKDAISNSMPPGGPRKAFADGWSMAQIAWKHPCALAMVNFGDPGGERPPSLVALVDLGRERAQFAKHLDGLLAAISDGGELPVRQVGDVSYRVLQVREAAEVAVGYMGNVFFLCFGGRELPQQIIALTQQKSLKADKRFADAIGEVSADDSQLFFYEDFAGIMAASERMAKQMREAHGFAEASTAGEITQVKRIFKAIGLHKTTVFAGATRLLPRGAYTKTKMFSPAPHEGLLKLAAGKPLVGADLAGVPADADFAAACNLSLSDFLAVIKAVAGAVDPDAADELEGGIAEAEDELGVSFEKDIFAALGDTWVVSSAESQGGFATGTVLTAEVKDAERLSAAIARIENYLKKQAEGMERGPQGPPMRLWACSMHPQVRMGGPGNCPICEMELVPIEVPFGPPFQRRRGKPFDIKAMKAGKAEIHYFAASVDHFPLPIAPAWAVHEGKLYVALWPQVVAAAIENPPVGARKAEAHSSQQKMLVRTSIFTEAHKMVSRKASILVYVNTGRIFKRLYPLLLVGGTMGANALRSQVGVDEPHKWLPSLPGLSKYLGAYIAAVSSDETGITYEEYGSTPLPGAAGVTSAPIALPGAVSWYATAQQRARVARGAANLYWIGSALRVYQKDHNGEYPPDFASLVKVKAISPSALVSPTSRNKAPKLVDGKLVGEVDYVYLGDKMFKKKVAGNMVLAYEEPEINRNRGTIVLFVSGEVRRMGMAEFKKALAYTREQLKKQK
ncbi:MAG: heavy metal-binding domain-containing protein [Planctomycetota bacterium]|jgi:hypothetical protein